MLAGDADCSRKPDPLTFSGSRSADLARRLYENKGWGSLRDDADLAVKVTTEYVRPLEFHANPGDYMPMPGDIVVFRPTMSVGTGHVAIVDSIDRGRLQLVEETGGTPARYSVPMSGTGIGGNVKGVLHSPSNLGNPAGAASVLRTVDGDVLLRQGQSAWRVIARHAVQVTAARSRMTGLVIAVRESDGDVLVRHGIDGKWIRQRVKARSIALAADDVHGASLAVVSRGHRIFLDQGLTGRLLQQGYGVRSVALSSSAKLGPVLAVVDDAGAPVIKEGPNGVWKKLDGRIRSVDVASNSRGNVFTLVITVTGRVLLHGDARWEAVAPSAAAAALEVSRLGTPTVAVLRMDGRAFVRTGLSGPLTARASEVSAMGFGTDSNGKQVLVIASGDQIALSTGRLPANDAPRNVREVTVQ